MCTLGDLNGRIGDRTRAGITGAFGLSTPFRKGFPIFEDVKFSTIYGFAVFFFFNLLLNICCLESLPSSLCEWLVMCLCVWRGFIYIIKD